MTIYKRNSIELFFHELRAEHVRLLLMERVGEESFLRGEMIPEPYLPRMVNPLWCMCCNPDLRVTMMVEFRPEPDSREVIFHENWSVDNTNPTAHRVL